MVSLEDWLKEPAEPARDARRKVVIPVPGLLEELGIKGTRRGGKWVALCPNPKHEDHHPSWSIVDREGDKKTGSHHCFSCGWGGGPWELAAAVWGVTVDEAADRLVARFARPAEPEAVSVPTVRIAMPGAPRKPFALPLGVVVPEPGGKWYQPAWDYLVGRGITPDQIARWGMGYATWGRCKNRVVWPVWTEGKLRTFSARAIDPAMQLRYDAGKESMGAEPKRAIWGEARWDRGAGVVVVAEGVPSALALERAGAINPSALVGSYLTPDRARLLSVFPRVLIATDPDEAGNKAAEALSVLGRRAKVFRLTLRLSPDDLPTPELAEVVRFGMAQVSG